MFLSSKFYLLLVLQGCIIVSRSEWPGLEKSCIQPGLNANPKDHQKYMVCFEDKDGSYRVEHYSCPRGHIFSPDANTCLPLNQVFEDIKTPSPKDKCGSNIFNCVNNDDYVVCGETAGTWEVIDEGNCTSLGYTCCSNTINGCTSNATLCRSIICTSDGFFPDPQDCTTYFRCKDKISSSNLCPLGQVFKPCCKLNSDGSYLASCVPPETPDDCVENSCKGLETYPGYETYTGCTQYYLLCLSESKYYEFMCTTAGQVFDGKKCNTPSSEFIMAAH